MARAGRFAGAAGFTLLEVLVAFAILAIAVVSLIELTGQGLRLLKLSADHQEAVEIADRIARNTLVNADDVAPDAPTIETGEEGRFAWERRIERLPLPEELDPTPETTGAADTPGLYAVSVLVRWGWNQSVEVATLRAPAPVVAQADQADTSEEEETEQPAQAGQEQGQRGQGQSGSATQSGSGSRSQSGRGQSSGTSGRDSGRTSR